MSAAEDLRPYSDVVVIGGGVIGCAIAREFVRAGIGDVTVLEAESDVGEGASKANSAIVHNGFDATPGTLEAQMLRRAADLWPSVVDELAVPFLRMGALMLARSDDEAARITTGIQPTATRHGVHTEILDQAALRSAAPFVTQDAVLGLAIPDESIIDPFWLTRAFAEAAMAGGATVIRRARVTSIGVRDDRLIVGVSDGRAIEAAQVVDAAGLRADEVARMAGDDDVSITPRRGQFLVTEETFGVDRIVLPVPGPMGKGMLVTPIVFGGALLGPTAIDGTDKDDRATRPEETQRILAASAALVPAMADAVPVRSFVGLRPVSSTGAFILRPSRVSDRLWLACGIRSTGISVSPAVAERVVADVMAARGWARTTPGRSSAPPPMEFGDAETEVVCLCRGVSRGELDAACRRPLGPLTLDGMKRRGGAMFGDCQGNLCAVAVAGIIAEGRGVDVLEIEKGPAGSWLFAGRTSEPRRGNDSAIDRAPSLAPAEDGSPSDLVVIGMGRAGWAAREAASRAGLRCVCVDRRDGWTAVGLIPEDDRWLVEVQGADRAVTIASRSVLLTTGGYVQPREQREIAGPRPAGIITADFVEASLAAGLRPGRDVVVVGSGPAADSLATALRRLGATIVERRDRAPHKVRGAERLEAVLFDDAWIEADTLVLADRLVPQAFLLRGLGLIDARPGTAAPVDSEGRLPLPGLWAAGCCVAPDIDHVGCAEAGRHVGGRIVTALLAASS